MAPIISQSLRSRRASDISLSSKSKGRSHARSEPMNIENVGSDDSSLFAGLEGFSPRDGPTISIAAPSLHEKSVQFDDNPRSYHSRPTHVGKYKFKSIGKDDDLESDCYDDSGTAMYSVVRSNSESSSPQGYLRSMKPMVDQDSAFGESAMASLDESDYQNSYRRKSYTKNESTLKHVSEDDDYYLREVRSPSLQSQRITNMLHDFERQMDANLASLTAEDEEREEVEMTYDRDYRTEEADNVEPSQLFSKIQKNFQEAKAEIQALKDSNEQLMSEIEQQEEEFESEKKLLEERARQKVYDLKHMYQVEIDNLVREKDAAIVESSQQAVRYGESGRKQIESLKNQLEKVKSQANGLIRQKIEEAIKVIQAKKDQELSERVKALQKSYESKFEKIKMDRDIHVKNAVNQAVSLATRQFLTDRDRQIDENVSIHCRKLELEKERAVRSVNEALEQNQRQITSLQEERHAMTQTLEFIKENINKDYPEQIIRLKQKSKGSRGSPFKMFKSQEWEGNRLEALLNEVIEVYKFLLEDSNGVQEEIDELEAKLTEQKELVTGHRAEIMNLRKSQQDDKDKIDRLESSLKNMTREKRAVEEKYRIAIDSHNAELDKLKSERSAMKQMEERRLKLAQAMAVGEAGLSRTIDTQHFLKPANPSHHISFKRHHLTENQSPFPFKSQVVHMNDDSLSLSACTMQSKLVDLTDTIEEDTLEPKTSPDKQEHFESIASPIQASVNSERIVATDKSVKSKNSDIETNNKLSDAKKKSYSIRNFKRSHHKVAMEWNAIESPSPRKPVTPVQNLSGLLERVEADNTSHTRDSLADASIQSLKTNTGVDTDATYTDTSREKGFAAMQRMNNRRRNPLGMFANAKKEKEEEYETILSDLLEISSPLNPSAIENRKTEITVAENLKEIPFPGFDKVPTHIIDAKKKPSSMKASGNTIKGSDSTADSLFSNLSNQENEIPTALALHTSTPKVVTSPAANGHTMCLRPLSVENSTLGLTESHSYMSEGIQSLETASDYISQGRMKKFPMLSNEFDENLAVDKQRKQRLSVSFPNQESPIQGRNIPYIPKSGLAPKEKKPDALSPTSEATTAVISHKYRPTMPSNFYNVQRNEKEQLPLQSLGNANAHRAKKIRARRIRRFEA